MPERSPGIEYFFSFVSLWSYIGSHIFQDIVKRHRAQVQFKPINLYAIFAAGGGKPVRERPLPRQACRLVKMQRWRDQYKIPLVLWPKFYPADPSLGHRMPLAALREERDVGAFAHAGLKAVGADEKDIADPDTLVQLANVGGLDGARLLAQANDPAIKAREGELSREAIDRRLFGSPFYFYRGEPFWGQDRLDQLENASSSGRPPIPWPKPDEL